MSDPLIHVHRGNPDDTELAAVLVALLVVTDRPVAPARPADAPWTRAGRYQAPGAWVWTPQGH